MTCTFLIQKIAFLDQEGIVSVHHAPESPAQDKTHMIYNKKL